MIVFYDQFRITKLKEIVIRICNKVVIRIFKIISRIDIHFEVRERVHGKLTSSIMIV